jgi:hypothetical protein
MARRPNLTPELRAEKRLEYNQCHALGHRWDPIPVTQPPSFGAAIDLRCENCSTVRRDILSRVSGVLLARYYDYPEDYHDYERHDKAWWRSAWLEKLADFKRELVNIENEQAKATAAAATRSGKPRKFADRGAQRGPLNPPPTRATRSRQTRRNTDGMGS